MWTRALAAIACGFVVLLTTVWPGDVPWGGDDVMLIANARAANAHHQLAAAGLGGSFNVPYGPLPTQFYQGLLLVTGDLPTVVRLRAGLTAGATATALLWLTASLGWSPWLAVLPLLSPFFWFYTRLLWDNTFALPVGATLLAGYADHLRRSSRAGLLVAVGCAAALPLIHPMTLPLAAAVAGHAVIFRRWSIARHWLGVTTTVVAVVAPSGRYLSELARRGLPPSPAVTYEPDADGYARMHAATAAAYPLLAGRLLSGYRFFDARGPERGWETTAVGTAARAASAVGFPLVVLGMAVAIVHQSRAVSARTGGGTPPSVSRAADTDLTTDDLRARHGPTSTSARPGRHDPALSIGTVSAAALALQSVLDAALRVAPFPHYFCGTWAAAVVCLWVGLRTIGRPGVVVGAAYAASLVVATTAFAVDIHRGRPPFIWHMPTLADHLRGSRVPD